MRTKNDKQEIGGWIHLQKNYCISFLPKQFLILLFSFFQDFDFMTSLKVFQYFSKFSQSQAGHKPGQTPKDPKAKKKKNKTKQRIDGKEGMNVYSFVSR